MHYFETFLPITMKPSEASVGYELWLEEFMNFWDVCHNAGSWENVSQQVLSMLISYIEKYVCNCIANGITDKLSGGKPYRTYQLGTICACNVRALPAHIAIASQL